VKPVSTATSAMPLPVLSSVRARFPPVFANYLGQLRAAHVAGFAPQAPSFVHYRGHIIRACRRVDVEAVDAVWLHKGPVCSACGDQGDLAGPKDDHLAADEEPAPAREGKRDLVFSMEVCREPTSLPRSVPTSTTPCNPGRR